mmetsp:Transcript_49496/g.115780  ORF Transcript_49496/g.115780 Transcript_49496/m.115780 type:complete len:340 (+) Transcript_49496:134-1153(+)
MPGKPIIQFEEEDEQAAVSMTWSFDANGTMRHRPTNIRFSPETGITAPGEGKEYKLSLKDIEIESSAALGAGACGTVVKGVIKTNGLPVAIKTIKVDDKGKREQLLHEISGLLLSDGCPNLVQCYGGFPSSKHNSVHIVLELMDCGSLADLKKRVAPGGVPTDPLACVTNQIMKGLQHLHSRRLLHRDIKPENILHAKTGDVKLTDFGIAKDLDTTLAVAATFVGTVTYMSPERCLGGSYATEADIWSVGMVIYELACGKYPFADVSTFPALFDQLCEKPEPRLDPSQFSEDLCDFVACCLTRDVAQRWHTERLLGHPFCKRGEGKEEQLSAFLGSLSR